MRHIRLIFGLFLVVFILTQCTNGPIMEKLWAKKSYQEKILGFYIDQSASFMMIHAQRYSYIIPCQHQLCPIAQASRQVAIKPHLTNLELHTDGQLSGIVTFYPLSGQALQKASEKTIRIYQQLKLVKERSSGYLIQTPTKHTFTAKTYKIDGSLPFENLDQPIEVEVKEQDSTLKKVGKITVSPAAIIIDTIAVPIVTLVAIPYWVHKHAP